MDEKQTILVVDDRKANLVSLFKGYKAGAVDCKIKPYKPAVLLAKVHLFLDLQRTKKELARRVLELSASEQWYRTLVTTIPDIVYRIDTEGRFTFLNEAVRSLGYGPEELIGLPFTEILFPADAKNVSRRFVLPRFAGKRTGDEGAPKLFDERRTGSRQTLTMEVHLVSRTTGRAVQGELHSGVWPMSTAEVNSSGLYGSIEGRPPTFLGTVGIIRDISQRKAAEDELNRYRQQLEKMVHEQTIELAERVKQINCLYSISILFAKPSESIDVALKSVVDLVPMGWRNPEVARSRIVFEGREFTAEGFRETPWKQSTDIVLSGKTVGTLEVCYLNRRYGCMGIGVPIEFAGDEEEASLFKEIAGDIAFALASIEQEETLHKSKLLLDARTRIGGAFLTAVDEDLFADVLDIVLGIMQSEFGIFGYIDEKGDLLVPSMTRHVWDQCRVPEKDIRFPRDTWGDSSW